MPLQKGSDYSLNRSLAAVFMCSCALVAAWLSMTHGLFFPIGNDGAGYIEEARNLLLGRGLVRAPFGIEPLDQDYIVRGVFPPGFALLLAAFGRLGIPLDTAAVSVPIGAWIVLPVAYVWAFFPLLPLRRAAPAAALLTFSPGIILAGGSVWTDIPFLALSLIAFGCLIRSFTSDHPARYAYAAGLVIGLCYWLRYAAVALIAVFFATMISAAILRFAPRRAVMSRLIAMLGGAVPILSILLIRNYVVFGTLQPYVAPSAPLDLPSLIAVARGYLSDLLIDLSGFHGAGVLAWDFKLLLLAVVPCAVYVGWLIWRRVMSGSSSIALRMTILALCLYLCAGSAMVVVTKARYGAIDDLRYVFQYSWIAVTLVALSLTSASLTRSAIKARDLALPLILVVLMFGRAGFAWQTADKEYRTQALFREYADWRSVAEHLPDPNWILTTQIKISLADNAPLEQAIERLPPNAYIMSNMAGVFIQTTKRPIRYIEADTPEGIARALVDLSKAIKAAHAPRPVYCVIAPTNRLVKIKGARSWTDTLVDDLPADYAIEWRRNDILILHYQPQDVSAKRFGTTTGADGHGR